MNPRTANAAIAENVARIRKDRPWSQREFAEHLAAAGLKIHASAVAKIETGERRVSIEELLQIAVALDVTPMALLLAHDGAPLAISPDLNVNQDWAQDWISGLSPLPAGWTGAGDQYETADGQKVDAFEVSRRKMWFEMHGTPRDVVITGAPGLRHLQVEAQRFVSAMAGMWRIKNGWQPDFLMEDPHEDAYGALEALRGELDRQAATLGASPKDSDGEH